MYIKSNGSYWLPFSAHFLKIFDGKRIHAGVLWRGDNSYDSICKENIGVYTRVCRLSYPTSEIYMDLQYVVGSELIARVAIISITDRVA